MTRDEVELKVIEQLKAGERTTAVLREAFPQFKPKHRRCIFFNIMEGLRMRGIVIKRPSPVTAQTEQYGGNIWTLTPGAS